MFKGVNHKIVEINKTGDEYIERAILFVNPDKADSSQKELMNWAEDYLELVSNKSPTKGKIRNLLRINYNWLKLTLIFALGGLFGYLIFYLLS